MATIKVSDKLGLDVDVEIKDQFSLPKYLKTLAQLDFKNFDLSQIPIQSARMEGALKQPIPLGTDKAELTISAGAGIALETIGSDKKNLFPNYYGAPIPIDTNQQYLALKLTATASASLAAKDRDLSFGFNPGAQVTFANYRLSTGRKIIDGLRELLQSFTIPGDVQDMIRMPQDSIAVVEGKGRLRFSAAANLLGVANPLAHAELPGALPSLNVGSGASIKVGASYTISGDYQIRVRKLDGGRIELGYYRGRNSEFGVNVSAGAGVTAGVESFDLLTQVFKAISNDPKLDREALKKSGLGEDKIAELEKVVVAATERKLELSLAAEFGAIASNEAAFLYDINLEDLDPGTHRALNEALDGDLTKFADHTRMPSGVRMIRSVFTETTKKTTSLRINLLGIYNFGSVSSLIFEGKAMFEPDSGELVLSDTTTASHLTAALRPFAADGNKLRKLLHEKLIVTATYHAVDVIHSSKVTAGHSYFELHSDTKRQTMKDNIEIGQAVDLVTEQEKRAWLEAPNWGRTMVYVEVDYEPSVVDDIFFNRDASGQLQPREQLAYELAGRDAMLRLVRSDDWDAGRRRPLQDNQLWEAMKKDPPRMELPDDIHGQIRNLIAGDYFSIIWWSKSMRSLAVALGRMRNLLATKKVDPEDNEFRELRRDLNRRLKSMIQDTNSRFGDPWGLIALDLAARQKGKVRLNIVAENGALQRERLLLE